ncbi:MAG: hypothetical protein R3348_02330, partial [Xanthomonadales bacterium]|nr:hypothetical protein [Xanthomonadales bacterium]
LPDTAGKFVFLLLVVGFIPVLVFAWAYEVTPEGIKRESEVDRSESITQETAARLNRTTIVLLVAVAVMVLVDRFIPQRGDVPGLAELDVSAETSGEPAAAPAETDVVEPAEFDDTPSVAVLPFVNMSSDEENEYFSDGITEELLNLLVRVDGLRVPSRTSSFAFKGQNTDIRDIARQLEVNHILEGSVRKAGNQVRITAQLIDVGSDTHLWSDTYDRELHDIFAIQSEIASEIVDALHVTLGGALTSSRPTDNMAAYNLFLQGRYLFQRRGNDLLPAEDLLSQAVEIDPEFAEAWATLALVHVMSPNYLGTPLEEAEPAARQAAEQAQALDASLVEPLMVRGNLAAKHSDLLGALEQLEEAVELQPKHVLARTWLGIVLLEAGYLQASRDQLERAMRDDPVSGLNADWLARALYYSGETEAARALATRAVELGRWAGFVPLSQIHLDAGEFEATRDLLEIIQYRPLREAFEYVIEARMNPGRKAQALEITEQINARGEDPARFVAAAVYTHLAEADKLFDILPQAIPRDATVYTVLWTPMAKPIRQHPRMKTFAAEHGLMEVWQARGWPDLCRPVGDDDFECDS